MKEREENEKSGYISPLKIPGLRDVAVKEYDEWLALSVSDDTLKTAFRQ